MEIYFLCVRLRLFKFCLFLNWHSHRFQWDANHGPSNARLNRPAGGGKTGAWSAKTNDKGQWIQVNLRELT